MNDERVNTSPSQLATDGSVTAITHGKQAFEPSVKVRDGRAAWFPVL